MKDQGLNPKDFVALKHGETTIIGDSNETIQTLEDSEIEQCLEPEPNKL